MIEYKNLCVDDIEKYKDSLVSLMENVLRDNISQKYPDNLAEQYVSKMPGYIQDGSAIIVGAITSEKLVGFSWAYELAIWGERRLHIDMICVDSEFRRRGLARTFIDLQKNEARKRGITIIEAMTTRANENSYNWFHAQGFVDERVKIKLEME